MAITSLPTPPSRSDPENFAERADAFMAALPRFANEANALQLDVTQSASNADNDATASAQSAYAADASRAAAKSSAEAAASSQQGAGQKAAESQGSAALARQWATKLGEPVEAGEFSAKHYAQLAAQGMGLPVFALGNIPTVDVGPIFVPTQGAMEWRSGRYAVLRADHGQCRFVYVSPNECRLVPHNGDGLVINGRQYRIDSAGVPLDIASVPGATGTHSYVYAKDNGSGSLTLVAEATGHSRHTDGTEIKTGDPSSTLVGVVYKNAGSVFVDSAAIRGVASWFNRYYKSASSTNFNTGTASAAPVQAIGPVYVWLWAGEGFQVNINGRTAVNVATASAYTFAYVDSVQAWGVYGTSATANAGVPVAITVPTEGTTEGFHSVATWLSVSGGGTSNCSLTQSIKAQP